MFRKRQDYPSPKPDPPSLTNCLLIILIAVCMIGLNLTVSNLISINEALRHNETNQGYTIPEVPISPYPR